MRFSMMSIAAFGFASVALAAPAALEKKDHRNYGVKTKVVTETTTVTYVSFLSKPPYNEATEC